ncbi:molybdate ABC transporter substrate-binding protein [Rhodanobacter sp. C03]|uniref:molybdate ABC transporter substrate-binding protein n=1 Tax=Rhodanobacter sp. C03 TaxID=1945858 RepID=UPI0009CBDA8B|nr:molybdate ABC transporter substrate-binding protein [Rhodanobacter sp. C03]OOG56533.1 molybdate ABC transporter substrate-binding protein [Rhodanobacter sp. C03]
MIKMRALLGGLLALALTLSMHTAHASQPRHMTIAAAADLHYALDAVIAAYHQAHPQDAIEVSYGSSGKLLAQIEQGAPFELFFSADSEYPKQLVAAGAASGDPVPYALGHIVIWSASVDASKLTVADLAKPSFDHIAIANPEHAPYGKRAEQALRAAGVWDAVQSRLVYGDNIAQTAQFIASGNAKVGIIAQSLALDPQMAKKGSYALIPATLYQPLLQSFVVTRRGADNTLAHDFARYMQGAEARSVLSRYGFSLPSPAVEH